MKNPNGPSIEQIDDWNDALSDPVAGSAPAFPPHPTPLNLAAWLRDLAKWERLHYAGKSGAEWGQECLEGAARRIETTMAEAHSQAVLCSSDLLAVLADRIEAQKHSYHLAHSGLATHVFETIAKEIRAVAKEARSTANNPTETRL